MPSQGNRFFTKWVFTLSDTDLQKLLTLIFKPSDRSDLKAVFDDISRFVNAFLDLKSIDQRSTISLVSPRLPEEFCPREDVSPTVDFIGVSGSPPGSPEIEGTPTISSKPSCVPLLTNRGSLPRSGSVDDMSGSHHGGELLGAETSSAVTSPTKERKRRSIASLSGLFLSLTPMSATATGGRESSGVSSSATDRLSIFHEGFEGHTLREFLGIFVESALDEGADLAIVELVDERLFSSHLLDTFARIPFNFSDSLHTDLWEQVQILFGINARGKQRDTDQGVMLGVIPYDGANTPVSTTSSIDHALLSPPPLPVALRGVSAPEDPALAMTNSVATIDSRTTPSLLTSSSTRLLSASGKKGKASASSSKSPASASASHSNSINGKTLTGALQVLRKSFVMAKNVIYDFRPLPELLLSYRQKSKRREGSKADWANNAENVAYYVIDFWLKILKKLADRSRENDIVCSLIYLQFYQVVIHILLETTRQVKSSDVGVIKSQVEVFLGVCDEFYHHSDLAVFFMLLNVVTNQGNASHVDTEFACIANAHSTLFIRKNKSTTIPVLKELCRLAPYLSKTASPQKNSSELVPENKPFCLKEKLLLLLSDLAEIKFRDIRQPPRGVDADWIRSVTPEISEMLTKENVPLEKIDDWIHVEDKPHIIMLVVSAVRAVQFAWVDEILHHLETQGKRDWIQAIFDNVVERLKCLENQEEDRKVEMLESDSIAAYNSLNDRAAWVVKHAGSDGPKTNTLKDSHRQCAQLYSQTVYLYLLEKCAQLLVLRIWREIARLEIEDIRERGFRNEGSIALNINFGSRLDLEAAPSLYRLNDQWMLLSGIDPKQLASNDLAYKKRVLDELVTALKDLATADVDEWMLKDPVRYGQTKDEVLGALDFIGEIKTRILHEAEDKLKGVTTWKDYNALRREIYEQWMKERRNFLLNWAAAKDARYQHFLSSLNARLAEEPDKISSADYKEALENEVKEKERVFEHVQQLKQAQEGMLQARVNEVRKQLLEVQHGMAVVAAPAKASASDIFLLDPTLLFTCQLWEDDFQKNNRDPASFASFLSRLMDLIPLSLNLPSYFETLSLHHLDRISVEQMSWLEKMLPLLQQRYQQFEKELHDQRAKVGRIAQDLKDDLKKTLHEVSLLEKSYDVEKFPYGAKKKELNTLLNKTEAMIAQVAQSSLGSQAESDLVGWRSLWENIQGTIQDAIESRCAFLKSLKDENNMNYEQLKAKLVHMRGVIQEHQAELQLFNDDRDVVLLAGITGIEQELGGAFRLKRGSIATLRSSSEDALGNFLPIKERQDALREKLMQGTAHYESLMAVLQRYLGEASRFKNIIEQRQESINNISTSLKDLRKKINEAKDLEDEREGDAVFLPDDAFELAVLTLNTQCESIREKIKLSDRTVDDDLIKLSEGVKRAHDELDENIKRLKKLRADELIKAVANKLADIHTCVKNIETNKLSECFLESDRVYPEFSEIYDEVDGSVIAQEGRNFCDEFLGALAGYKQRLEIFLDQKDFLESDLKMLSALSKEVLAFENLVEEKDQSLADYLRQLETAIHGIKTTYLLEKLESKIALSLNQVKDLPDHFSIKKKVIQLHNQALAVVRSKNQVFETYNPFEVKNHLLVGIAYAHDYEVLIQQFDAAMVREIQEARHQHQENLRKEEEEKRQERDEQKRSIEDCWPAIPGNEHYHCVPRLKRELEALRATEGREALLNALLPERASSPMNCPAREVEERILAVKQKLLMKTTLWNSTREANEIRQQVLVFKQFTEEFNRWYTKISSAALQEKESQDKAKEDLLGEFNALLEECASLVEKFSGFAKMSFFVDMVNPLSSLIERLNQSANKSALEALKMELSHLPITQATFVDIQIRFERLKTVWGAELGDIKHQVVAMVRAQWVAVWEETRKFIELVAEVKFDDAQHVSDGLYTQFFQARNVQRRIVGEDQSEWFSNKLPKLLKKAQRLVRYLELSKENNPEQLPSMVVEAVTKLRESLGSYDFNTLNRFDRWLTEQLSEGELNFDRIDPLVTLELWETLLSSLSQVLSHSITPDRLLKLARHTVREITNQIPNSYDKKVLDALSNMEGEDTLYLASPKLLQLGKELKKFAKTFREDKRVKPLDADRVTSFLTKARACLEGKRDDKQAIKSFFALIACFFVNDKRSYLGEIIPLEQKATQKGFKYFLKMIFDLAESARVLAPRLAVREERSDMLFCAASLYYLFALYIRQFESEFFSYQKELIKLVHLLFSLTFLEGLDYLKGDPSEGFLNFCIEQGYLREDYYTVERPADYQGLSVFLDDFSVDSNQFLSAWPIIELAKTGSIQQICCGRGDLINPSYFAMSLKWFAQLFAYYSETLSREITICVDQKDRVAHLLAIILDPCGTAQNTTTFQSTYDRLSEKAHNKVDSLQALIRSKPYSLRDPVESETVVVSALPPPRERVEQAGGVGLALDLPLGSSYTSRIVSSTLVPPAEPLRASPLGSGGATGSPVGGSTLAAAVTAHSSGLSPSSSLQPAKLVPPLVSAVSASVPTLHRNLGVPASSVPPTSPPLSARLASPPSPLEIGPVYRAADFALKDNFFRLMEQACGISSHPVPPINLVPERGASMIVMPPLPPQGGSNSARLLPPQAKLPVSPPLSARTLSPRVFSLGASNRVVSPAELKKLKEGARQYGELPKPSTPPVCLPTSKHEHGVRQQCLFSSPGSSVGFDGVGLRPATPSSQRIFPPFFSSSPLFLGDQSPHQSLHGSTETRSSESPRGAAASPSAVLLEGLQTQSTHRAQPE